MQVVRVACVLQSKFIDGRVNEALDSREKRIGEAQELLDQAGRGQADIAVLCEAFADGNDLAFETIDGPTIGAVAECAAKHGMYVIAPFMELDDDGKRYNTAALIGRDGRTVGKYCKNIPFWSEAGVTPGVDRCVYQTDFGCIGIAICFESNWPDVWMDLGDQGAQIVFWPSAYSGGRKLCAAAIYNNFYVVSCTTVAPDSTAVDITGDVLSYARGPHQVVFHSLDLDRCLAHDNFNGPKLAQLRREYADRIRMQYLEKEGWWLVQSCDPSVSIRKLFRERGIESLRDYTRRSRREIYYLRKHGLSMPDHGPVTGRLSEEEFRS